MAIVVAGVGKKLGRGMETQTVKSFCADAWSYASIRHDGLYVMPSGSGEGASSWKVVQVDKSGVPVEIHKQDLSLFFSHVSVLSGTGVKGEEDCVRGVNGEDRSRLNACAVDSLRKLVQIVTLPFFTADGVWVSEEGYNVETRTLLQLVGKVPSPVQATERGPEVLERLTDFRYRTPSDLFAHYSVFLCGLMLPTIFGPKPIHPFCGGDAKTGTGSGKSYSADIAQLFVDGRVTSGAGFGSIKDAQKASKVIVGAFYHATGRTVRLENPPSGTSVLGNDMLLSAASAVGPLQVPITGQNLVTVDPRGLMVLASQNQPIQDPESSRRLMPVNLVQRAKGDALYRTPDLRRWVRENRLLIAQVLAEVVKAWQEAGSPVGAVEPMLGFEDYQRWVLDPLLYAASVGLLPGVLPGFEFTREVFDPLDDEIGDFMTATKAKEKPGTRTVYTPTALAGLLESGEWPGMPGALEGLSSRAAVNAVGRMFRARVGQSYDGLTITSKAIKGRRGFDFKKE